MEIEILNWIQTLRTPFFDTIVPMVSSLGNMGWIWIVLAVGLMLFPKKRKTGVILSMALVIDAILCNVIIKNLVCRVRPFHVNTAIELLIPEPGEFSFPSGHTAVSFAAVAALYFAGEKRLFLPALVLATMIALTRLYLYVHYPTDVLGGILIGILSGYLAGKVGEKLRKTEC